MKELCKLAEEKGFEPHTFSTRWTFDYYLERGKAKFMVNKECDITLLAEIQYWLHTTYNIFVAIYPIRDKWDGDVRIITLNVHSSKNEFEDFNSFEDALEFGLVEGLKLI